MGKGEIQARLLVLEQQLGRTKNQLGDDAGLSNGLTGKWKDEHLEKITGKVEQFLNYHRINPEWWRTGQGEIFLPNSPKVRLIEHDVWEELKKNNDLFRSTTIAYQLEVDRLWGIINHFTSKDGGADIKAIHKN